MNTWLYWQLHVAPPDHALAGQELNRRYHELLVALEPLMERLQQEALAERWFFLRYLEDGPHVRLRIKGPSVEVREVIEPWMATWYDAHAWGWPRPGNVAGLYELGAIREHAYEPEYATFGGPVGVECAERHFTHASALSLRLLARQPGAVSQWALSLIGALLDAFGIGGGHRADFLRGHALFWVGAQAEPSLARAYAQRRTLFRPYQAGTPGPETAGDPEAYQRWVRAVQADASALYSRAAELLVPPGLSPARLISSRIASSYLHLLCNRLGLSYLQEAQLVYGLIPEAARQPLISVGA